MWSGDRQFMQEKVYSMLIKMIQDLRKWMEAQTKNIYEMFNKKLEYIKNKWTQMNSTATKIKFKKRKPKRNLIAE